MNKLASREVTCGVQIFLAIAMLLYSPVTEEWKIPWSIFWLSILVINAIALFRQLAKRARKPE